MRACELGPLWCRCLAIVGNSVVAYGTPDSCALPRTKRRRLRNSWICHQQPSSRCQKQMLENVAIICNLWAKRWKQPVFKDQAEEHQSDVELSSLHKISMMRDASFWNSVWDRIHASDASQHLNSICSQAWWSGSHDLLFLGGDRSEGRGDCSSSEEAWGFCGDLAEAVWGACDLERFSKLVVT